MQTPREVIHNTIAFNNPDRLGHSFPEPFGDDTCWSGFWPSPDARPNGGNGVDEWGAEWQNLGVCWLGEVKKHPLLSWDDWHKISVPDIRAGNRFDNIRGARQRAGDLFLMGPGVSLYERAHYLRGLENVWADLYENPGKLGALIDIFVDQNLHIIGEYAQEEYDGFILGDDWGLQNQLMISPEKWREIWKPRYAKIFAAAHARGMKTLLHSCGHIVAILDDLIEIGLDVIQMDQQMNMGLELLSERFVGRIAFYNPVDIQAVMPRADPAEIRAYCRKMVKLLSTPRGGFIAKFYPDPKGVGHRQEAINVMCEEFLQISREMYGA